MVSTSVKAGHCANALTSVPTAAITVQAGCASLRKLCTCAKPGSWGGTSASVHRIQRIIKHLEVVVAQCRFAVMHCICT